MCANSRRFNTELNCFRAGLIVGKLLTLNGDKAWMNSSDSPRKSFKVVYEPFFHGGNTPMPLEPLSGSGFQNVSY
jgi:hypothetical protein